MQSTPPELMKIIHNVLFNENPLTILEVSGFDAGFGQQVVDYYRNPQDNDISSMKRLDRIDLSDGEVFIDDGVYNNIYIANHLIDTGMMDNYDMMIIYHLFENMIGDDAKALLTSLLKKVKKQVLVITPVYPYDLEHENKLANIRVYHPVFFLGMDFSYKTINTTDGTLQAYSFFPKIDYELLPCDILEENHYFSTTANKLRIAYIIPHHILTGGVKAMLQQMKELTGKGHRVVAYFRSDEDVNAIPYWSHLTDDDVADQIVISLNAGFLDHIKNIDIIVIGWINHIPEFSKSDIPVVLWEQGYERFYGDFFEFQTSTSAERQYMHSMYRMPIHLLAVSETIRTVLKGIYNRNSQFYPNGIDTDFYYPLEQKNNVVPVILLVGNPRLSFKGFDFSVKALSAAYQAGLDFRVWWASQVEVAFGEGNQMFEIFQMPSQEKLAELYRSADIFLSTSLYESFPLPPIEAMASGTAVVATDSGGINTYAKPGVNCILCDQGDFDSVVIAIQYLLTNPEVRDVLAKEGRKTALEYSFDNIAPKLEQCFYKILESK